MVEPVNQLEKPAGSTSPTVPEPVIHVMPAEFRAGKMPMSVPPKPVTPPLPPAPPKPVPPPPKPPVAPEKLFVKKRRLSPIIIVGIIVFIAVSVGAVALLLSLNQPAPVVTNTVVNTVKPEPEPEPEPEPKPEPEPVVVEPTGGTDADSDGLTDIEEVLFGSDRRNPDSDSDTYLDGNEVYHLYNPRGNAPGLLIDTGFARNFGADAVDFVVVYPSRWTVQLLSNDAGVMFKVPTGEYVEVRKVAKDSSVDIASWYLSQRSEAKANELTPITTRQNYTGIVGPDNMSTYLNMGQFVYVLTYDLGEVKAINFLTTYQMIVNSLILTK